MSLDIKTFVVMNCIINAISAWAMALIWRENRRRYAGIFLWLCDMALQAVGMGLIALRGFVPDVLSILAANAMIMLGAVLLLFGLRRFVGRRSWDAPNLVLLVLFIGYVAFFSLIRPDLPRREIGIMAMIVGVVSQMCWLIFRRTGPAMRRIMRVTGIILAGYVIVSLARGLYLIAFPAAGNDFFRLGPVDTLSIACYTTLSACLTVSLILLVNRRLLAAVRAQEEKFTKAFHSSPNAILLTKMVDGRIFEVNDAFEHLTGYHPDAVVGRSTADLHFWLRDADRIAVAASLTAGNPVRGLEVTLRRRSGECITALYAADLLIINDEPCILSNLSDITELSAMKTRLQELATHDALTGLANRTLFQEHFAQALAAARRDGFKLAVMSLDLDRFKAVNDSLGHPVGDKVLVEAATRLRDLLRQTDTVARFGGDEFVLLAGAIRDRAAAAVIAEKILARFREPFAVNNSILNLTASIGVALFPDDGIDPDTLIERSDSALYYAKAAGRDGYWCEAREEKGEDGEEEEAELPPAAGRD